MTAHLMMALREEANTARRAVQRAEKVEDSLKAEQEAAKYYADASVHVLEAAHNEASIAWQNESKLTKGEPLGNARQRVS